MFFSAVFSIIKKTENLRERTEIDECTGESPCSSGNAGC